jgi:2-iminobutanoate/2-iminopropanoate deaminase
VIRLHKERIETGSAPSAIGPYSQAIKAGEASLVFVSGQIPMNAAGEIVGGTAAEQARVCLENVGAILEAAGGGMESVVKVIVFLRTMEDFDAVNEVYSAFFEPPYPARSCIGGLELPKGALVKIEAVAAVKNA